MRSSLTILPELRRCLPHFFRIHSIVSAYRSVHRYCRESNPVELQQLRYFLALARLGNFTRAAAACNVAQPTLSQQIAKLEQEFGVPLFDRLARGAELTAAGRLLRERAEQALGLLDDAKESVSADAGAGRLTVAAIPTIAPYFLPKVLLRFAAERPDVKLEVREETTADCLDKLTAGEIDLAVMALPVRGDHLNSQTLFTEELLLAVADGHRLSTKPQVRLKDLTDESFLLLHEAHCLTGQAMNFCARHALAPLVTARLHQLGTVLELVRLGQGVSLVPAMAIADGGHPGLVFRSMSGEKPTRIVGAIWSKLRFHGPLLEAFLEQLVD